MSQEFPILVEESKKLICESLAKISEIVAREPAELQAGTPQRQVPLFFPQGIGSITLTATVTSIGTLTFTISGSSATKPDVLGMKDFGQESEINVPAET